jgi:predicted glycosyltransferase
MVEKTSRSVFRNEDTRKMVYMGRLIEKVLKIKYKQTKEWASVAAAVIVIVIGCGGGRIGR